MTPDSTAPPPPESLPRRMARWLSRGVAIVALILLAGWLERAAGSPWPAAVAAGGAAAGLLAIGAAFARTAEILHNRMLDRLLFLPWAMLFVLALRALEGGIGNGPLRALAAAAASTLAALLLTVTGVMLRQAAGHPR